MGQFAKYRSTIAKSSIRISGIGLHTGDNGSVIVHPKRDNTAQGIYFQASDSSHDPIRVTVETIADTRRCTSLKIGQVTLSTVEHLLSAISGAGITDAIVEFSGPEVPILDGSSLPFSNAIIDAGIQNLSSKIQYAKVEAPIIIDGKVGECLIALPADIFSATIVIEYPDAHYIGVQAAGFSGDDYATQIATARTYGFLSELEQLRQYGLARGVSLFNCVALNDDGSADPRTPLRFPNELARHKLLDLVGDLALVGLPILGRIIAIKPSHTVNCSLARKIFESTV